MSENAPASGECPECGHTAHGVIRCRDGGCGCIYTSDYRSAPSPPSPGRMSDEEFDRLLDRILLANSERVSDPVGFAMLFGEARRAREDARVMADAMKKHLDPDWFYKLELYDVAAAVERNRSKP